MRSAAKLKDQANQLFAVKTGCGTFGFLVHDFMEAVSASADTSRFAIIRLVVVKFMISERRDGAKGDDVGGTGCVALSDISHVRNKLGFNSRVIVVVCLCDAAADNVLAGEGGGAVFVGAVGHFASLF